MTSLEKMKFLLTLQREGKSLKITTTDGKEFLCKPLDPAEDEEDWAYHFVALDNPFSYFILECNYIESIEEIGHVEAVRLKVA